MQEAALQVLANVKKDSLRGADGDELSDQLGLNALRGRDWHVQAVCAATGRGIFEGMDWLSGALASKRCRTPPLMRRVGTCHDDTRRPLTQVSGRRRFVGGC